MRAGFPALCGVCVALIAGLLLLGTVIGAPLLMGADLLSRVVQAPQELPLGIFTAAAGGVFVLALVTRPSRF